MNDSRMSSNAELRSPVKRPSSRSSHRSAVLSPTQPTHNDLHSSVRHNLSAHPLPASTTARGGQQRLDTTIDTLLSDSYDRLSQTGNTLTGSSYGLLNHSTINPTLQQTTTTSHDQLLNDVALRTNVLENVTIRQEQELYERGALLRKFAVEQAEKDAELRRVAEGIKNEGEAQRVQQQYQHEQEMQRLFQQLDAIKAANINAAATLNNNNGQQQPATLPLPPFTYGLPISPSLSAALQQVALIRSPAAAYVSTPGMPYGSNYPLAYPYFPILSDARKMRKSSKSSRQPDDELSSSSDDGDSSDDETADTAAADTKADNNTAQPTTETKAKSPLQSPTLSAVHQYPNDQHSRAHKKKFAKLLQRMEREYDEQIILQREIQQRDEQRKRRQKTKQHKAVQADKASNNDSKGAAADASVTVDATAELRAQLLIARHAEHRQQKKYHKSQQHLQQLQFQLDEQHKQYLQLQQDQQQLRQQYDTIVERDARQHAQQQQTVDDAIASIANSRDDLWYAVAQKQRVEKLLNAGTDEWLKQR